MALVDIGYNWQQEFDSAERLHQITLTQIGERGRKPRHSSAYTQASEEIAGNLSQLSATVLSLKRKLEAESANLTAGERSRRESLLDRLCRKEVKLKEAFSSTNFGGESQDRSRLFNTSRSSRGAGLADMGTTGWGDSHVETEETAQHSSQTLKQRQEEARADQDAGLDMLHSVILRQKAMAQQIGDEVVQQNELLDDIDVRMDSTTQRLIDNTQNVRVVGNKDRTCGYWVVILLLFIAIVVVAFV